VEQNGRIIMVNWKGYVKKLSSTEENHNVSIRIGNAVADI
jgi:hypothetical protein